MASTVPTFTLNNGTTIPAIGMGCSMHSQGGGDRVEEMVRKSLKHGYRHFDTASISANEENLGKALKESGIPRKELYVATKLWNNEHHKVQEAFEASLKRLDTEYIDLYLMHWPQAVIKGTNWFDPPVQPEESPTYVETWKEMEKLLATGRVKSIGVSNFSIKTLDHLIKNSTVVPAVNQVEMHPCLPENELKEYCDSKGILLVAYSPLGQSNPLLLAEPTITSVAEKHNATPAQVLLSWAVQRGTAVIPKTENEDRMKANLQLLKLSEDDMAAVNAIHKKPGMHKSISVVHTLSDDGTVFGWTYEQLGWNMVKGGIVPQ
ncbi:Aldo/keto reductase [Punctularia strigosozonata HHB-11173 SS5]|uniref:Aldo/keto reductase n=1 Tax=Punctularia strigosozonata (strain HHB-11173) TaxID=741275 RepID=UPI00044163A7|nr:Aldo/keto reductase [Punctularia strigosozonata HHB-11173 SS5]EIN09898.1 Aldo/keto reductase [Punctularia strigosozonata HHB-11173 SS5]